MHESNKNRYAAWIELAQNAEISMTEQPLPPAAIQALEQGRMIEAIKIVRTEHHLSLKQAKDQVEQYVQQHPALLRQSRVAQMQQQGSVQRMIWLLGFVLLLAVLAWQNWA